MIMSILGTDRLSGTTLGIHVGCMVHHRRLRLLSAYRLQVMILIIVLLGFTCLIGGLVRLWL